MKVCKQNQRKYYKYQYNDFVQPVLTSNGVLGGNSFAVSGSDTSNGNEPYKAFDGNADSTVWNSERTTGVKWISFYNPKELRVTQLSIFEYYNPADNYVVFYIKEAIIQGSNNGEDWSDIKTITKSSWLREWVIDLSDNKNFYKYYRIYITDRAYYDNTYCSIPLNEIVITGQERATIESTQDDYDYFVEGLVYLLPAKTTRNYYKYLPTKTFNMCAIAGAFSSSGWQSASKGDNYLYGSSNAYEVGQNRVSSTTYTWNNPIPAGIYVYNLSVGGQGNGYYNNPAVSVVYENGTSDIVYSETFSKNSYNQDFSFEAKYPVKSITLEGILTHTSSQYVGIGATLTSKTFSEKILGSESDYDTYEDKTTYYGIGG